MTNRKLAYIVKDQNPLVLAVNETVQQACQCMRERSTGSVLVVDDQQRLCGIFTGRDAVRALAQGQDAAVTVLAQSMTPNPVTITPESRAIDALRKMSDRRLPSSSGRRERKDLGCRLARRFQGDGDRSTGRGRPPVGMHPLMMMPRYNFALAENWPVDGQPTYGPPPEQNQFFVCPDHKVKSPTTESDTETPRDKSRDIPLDFTCKGSIGGGDGRDRLTSVRARPSPGFSSGLVVVQAPDFGHRIGRSIMGTPSHPSTAHAATNSAPTRKPRAGELPALEAPASMNSAANGGGFTAASRQGSVATC